MAPEFTIIVPTIREKKFAELKSSIENSCAGMSYELIPRSDDGGSLEGIRQGYKLAQGKYIIFMPDDVFMCLNALQSMKKFMESNEGLFIAAFSVNSEPPDSSPMYFSRRFARYPCMSRENIELIGGLIRDGYHHFYGDADLSLRVWEAGGKFLLNDESQVLPNGSINYDEVYCNSYDRYYELDRNLFQQHWQKYGEVPMENHLKP